MNIQKRKGCPHLAALLLFGSLVGGADATVLTFNVTGLSNFQSAAQGYGDNVTAVTMGSFSYGSAEGFTPNVTVSYGDTDPSYWTTNYGNLTNVLFEDADNIGILQVTLTAEVGYNVVLHGFDLAAYNPGFTSDPSIDIVDVSAGATQLFHQENAVISETTFTPYSFLPELQAQELVITIDARNLGNLNDDIAIDNIVFSQVRIPEPSSSLLLGLGGLVLAAKRRR